LLKTSRLPMYGKALRLYEEAEARVEAMKNRGLARN
jgi:hypothetical protein